MFISSNLYILEIFEFVQLFIAHINTEGNFQSCSLNHTFCLSSLLVRPLPPWDIRIRFVNASVSRCTLQWRDEGLVRLNRLRYRPNNSRSWNTVMVFRVKGKKWRGSQNYCTDLCPFIPPKYRV